MTDYDLCVSRGVPDGPHFDDDALWRMDEDPAAVLSGLRRRFGDLFTIHRAGAPPRVVLTTGPHIRELIRRDPGLHSCGTGQFAQLVGEHSVNMLSGEAHRRMRRLLLPPLSGRALAGRAPQLRRIIREELDGLSGGRPVPLIDLTGEIALRITASLLFAPMTGPRARAVCGPLLEIIDAVHEHRSVPPAHRRTESPGAMRAHLMERRSRLDRQLSAQIAEHRSRPGAGSGHLLGHLLAAPAPLSDPQIRDQLVTMLVAGHLTTASGLAMAAYWMNQPGGHAAAAAAELDGLPDDACAADLAELRHLAAFCDETLRIGSVVPHSSGRRTAAPLTAFGHRLPAGTELIVSLHLAHRDPQAFPDPEAFRPGRFLDSPPPAHRFVPFGVGTRRCPGAALVALEMKVFLAELRRTSDLELIGADPPFRTVSLGSTLAPPARILVRRTGRARATAPGARIRRTGAAGP